MKASESNKPLVFHTIAELRGWRSQVSGQVGFVPTMGALHEGHATLLRKLQGRCDHSVLSIFVNPTQFGPKEDFSKYPKTWEKDLQIAEEEKVSVVFAPTASEIFPDGYSTYVEETQLSGPLCGIFRPGHFRGVTTVVLKLFNLVQPDLALFGLKDAQQFFVLERMVRDLNLDLKIEGVPTVREPTGLALSSRNVYLTNEEREKAPLIYSTLCRIQDGLLKGEKISKMLEEGAVQLTQAGFQVQYLECRDLATFGSVQNLIQNDQGYLIAVSAYLGSTRLIDNVIINPTQSDGTR